MSTRTLETVEIDAKIRALVEKPEWTAEDEGVDLRKTPRQRWWNPTEQRAA